METHLFKQVDFFTDKPFWGNPVAIIFGAIELQPPREHLRLTGLSESIQLHQFPEEKS